MISVNQIARLVLFLIGGSIAFTFAREKPSTLFTYHPVLMSVGYLILMTEGVLRAIEFRSTPPSSGRVRLIWIHSIFQVTAILCILTASYSIWETKNRMKKPHLSTYHGKAGALATFVSIWASMNGTLSFKKLGLFDLLPASIQGRIKWAHRTIGFTAWCLAIVAIELALGKPTMQRGSLSAIWRVGVAVGGGLVLLPWSKGVIKMKS